MISIIIPTYEEKGNIPKLCTRISDSLSEKGIKYEIIFIDDNSQDGTIEEIKEAQKSYPIRQIGRAHV